MILRLADPSFVARLAAFLGSVGVEATVRSSGVLEMPDDADRGELAIYLRVWGVLHPEAPATLEP